MKLLPLLLLAGCVSVPIEELSDLTPADCRAYGVEVADGSPVTGTIVRSEFGWTHDLYRECGGSASGCAKPVGGITAEGSRWRSPTNEYEVWYSDNQCVAQHEKCHVAYETWNHTVSFFVRQAQGDRFAACPAGHPLLSRNPFKALFYDRGRVYR